MSKPPPTPVVYDIDGNLVWSDYGEEPHTPSTSKPKTTMASLIAFFAGVLFEWSALDHVGLEDSNFKIDQDPFTGDGERLITAYDYLYVAHHPAVSQLHSQL